MGLLQQIGYDAGFQWDTVLRPYAMHMQGRQRRCRQTAALCHREVAMTVLLKDCHSAGLLLGAAAAGAG